LKLLAVCIVAITVALGFAGPPEARAEGCPNEAVRSDQRAELPDCRAYELVTPADIGGGTPEAVKPPPANAGGSDEFSSPPAAASGNSFVFALSGTSLAGFEGGGYTNAYRAKRGASGWSVSLYGPSGREAAITAPGGYSADHEFETFRVPYLEGRFSGSLALGDGMGQSRPAGYVRYPDGDIRLLGEGTLPSDPDTDGHSNGFADDPDAVADWISANGDHIVFDTAAGKSPPVQLTSDAPPSGTSAVYDRTPTGLNVVSLLPGNAPPATDSVFEGASANGRTVLFSTGSALFARVDDIDTYPITEGGFSAAGVSEEGRWVFYAKNGDLFRVDLVSQQSTEIASSGDAQFANVSGDGSHVYFVSTSQLDGAQGIAGSPNLYVWDGQAIRFIATVALADVSSSPGLTEWVDGPARNEGFLRETSRATPDGSTFVFESLARLTGYDNDGKREVYRFDGSERSLECVSCGSTSGLPRDGAELASRGEGLGDSAEIPNLSNNGEVVFFQSDEALVPTDLNGVADVYEWNDGRIALISGGRSTRPSTLMGATPSGSDVFFRTTERLVPGGQEPGAPAVYDARVGGGFEAQSTPVDPCKVDFCRGPATAPPVALPAGSAAFVGPHNHRNRAHRVRKHRHRHRHHRSGARA
jgi:hypothetical protein